MANDMLSPRATIATQQLSLKDGAQATQAGSKCHVMACSSVVTHGLLYLHKRGSTVFSCAEMDRSLPARSTSLQVGPRVCCSVDERLLEYAHCSAGICQLHPRLPIGKSDSFPYSQLKNTRRTCQPTGTSESSGCICRRSKPCDEDVAQHMVSSPTAKHRLPTSSIGLVSSRSINSNGARILTY